ncbi:hypothetical protein [Streptomyces globisporus]|uniref:hypothetical protein n=1 Tax=Streptomyces globisporus TaxID=1908 RepID=UPI0004C54F8B|nr:hypothetical protein [Streptomyces globisporus]
MSTRTATAPLHRPEDPVPSSFIPPPPGHTPEPHPSPTALVRERDAQWTFLVANALPLAVGILLSWSSSLSGVRVYGHLTLGIAWGLLQLGIFMVTAWRYEDRAAGTSRTPDETGR